MVPLFLIPSEWLVAIHSLPRAGATLVLLGCTAMLALGLRYHRVFLCLGFFVGGAFAGAALAELMHVNTWFVALPAGAAVAPIPWREQSARWILPPLIGFLVACNLGSFLTYGIKVANFWLGFSLGAVGGAVLTLVVRRFMVTLACAVVGAGGVLGALGAVVRAGEGFFSPGGYWGYRPITVMVGLGLVIVSMVVQVMLEAEQE